MLGGVRSGKSEVAERLAGAGASAGPVTYVATGLPGDEDFAARVALHRARRPAHWSTIEEPRAVPPLLARLPGPVLLDALGTWIANDPHADVGELVTALTTRQGDTVVVSEEVGLGVHPPTEIGRLFADRLGETNRRVAEVADRCLLVVAGRVIELPAGPAPRGRGPAPLPDDRPLRAALAFLTPLGGAVTPGPRAFSWFPVVGAALGLVLGAVWWAADRLVGPLVAAAVVVVADLVLTGALHFDGLVDSADGLLAHLPPERRLAVMQDPAVGAFGVAAGGSCLLLRTVALAELGGLSGLGHPRPWLLAGLWSLSRTSMAVVARTLPYARREGLASAFGPDRSWTAVAVGGGALALALGFVDDPFTPVTLAVAAWAAAAVHRLARRRLGGFTGDVLGAAGVSGETAGLLVAAAVGILR